MTYSARLFYQRLGLFLVANLLWIITSLPLITMPAAAGGLFYLVSRVIAEERDLEPDEATINDFWIGFRRYWREFSLLGFFDLAIFSLLSYAAIFYWQSTVEPLSWLAGPLVIFFLTFLGMQLFLFPLQLAYSTENIWDIFRRSFSWSSQNRLKACCLSPG